MPEYRVLIRTGDGKRKAVNVKAPTKSAAERKVQGQINSSGGLDRITQTRSVRTPNA